MMKDELKKKIFSIVRGAMLEADELSFIETTDNIADALIAAGIGDVETVQKIAASATAMAVLEAAKAEHRAEVAERAVYNLAYGEWQRGGARRAICEKYAPSTARDYLDRAEKELAKEGEE